MLRAFLHTCTWRRMCRGLRQTRREWGEHMMSMHKLTAGDGYAYLTRQVAAGVDGCRERLEPAN